MTIAPNQRPTPISCAQAAIFLIAIGGCGLLAAQADEREAQREKLHQQRAAIQARHDTAVAACRERFAVTDCTLKADRARREALSDVKLQELLLEQSRRREAGAQAQARIDAKRQAQQEKVEQRGAPAP
jgi:colicin import membrane protein